MSVLITQRISADPKAIMATDQSVFDAIVARAHEFGVIRHRFFATATEVLIVDEWPDEDSFHRFFAASPDIGEAMAAAGVTSQPLIEVWDRLGVEDAIGWD